MNQFNHDTFATGLWQRYHGGLFLHNYSILKLCGGQGGVLSGACQETGFEKEDSTSLLYAVTAK